MTAQFHSSVCSRIGDAGGPRINRAQCRLLPANVNGFFKKRDCFLFQVIRVNKSYNAPALACFLRLAAKVDSKACPF
jgi:hypothetical protein